MTYRIGWISPLTPKSGIGSCTKAILDAFPATADGEDIDVTVFYVDHETIYRIRQRTVKIIDTPEFHDVLGLFDVLIYNIGNNREHHEGVYSLLRLYPGIIVAHDYVYQHYIADRSLRASQNFASYAALLVKFAQGSVSDYIRNSRVTSRTGRIRYSPWDSGVSAQQPMSEAIVGLGSAVIVHSNYARRYVEQHFEGPILQLGLPHDQKPQVEPQDLSAWAALLGHKRFFDIVSFGHIQPSKCVELVIDAIGGSAALKQRVRFTVAGFIGDAGYYGELKSRVQALGLADQVIFEVGVSEGRLAELMRAADIFVNLRQPNTEGASLSLVEQLDAGKPVIVIDSGCYAEIPDDAARRVPVEATSEHIRTVIEDLIDDPAAMVKIGAAGRRHARTWTCASYARELVRFGLKHKALLARRAAMRFHTNVLSQTSDDDSVWAANLARTRASHIYLDRNLLAVDPAVILAMPRDELCDYVCEIIFGLFSRPRLRRALGQYFALLGAHGAYWACVRFALLADATFGDDETASRRLMNAAPCYEPEFWAVVELLPPRQFMTAATLILAKRRPSQDELSGAASDDADGFPSRLRLARLLQPPRAGLDDQITQLHRWTSEKTVPMKDTALPALDDTLLDAGSEGFRSSLDLSGFYAIETDRVWTRSGRGFIGMRLAPGTTVIEVQVYHLTATAQKPCEIVLALDDVVSRVKVTDTSERWISLTVAIDRDRARRVQWVSLSTDRTGVPQNSSDTRVLGLCVRKARIRKAEELIDLEAQRMVAVARLNEAAAHMRSSGSPVVAEPERRSAG